MAPETQTPSGISVVKDGQETEKVEAATVPEFVQGLKDINWADDRIFRFYLISTLTSLRFSLEELVEEFRKAPTQRTMQIPISAEQQLAAQEQISKMLGVPVPGRRS